MFFSSESARSSFALILLGNSGVGKSFLANLILDRPLFEHRYSARSVTHHTDSAVCRVGGRDCRVYDIPGLIEGDALRIDSNREEIQRAFREQRGAPVVLVYVFGHQNGRLRNEDVTSFRALNLDPDALLIVVNGLPRARPATYDEQLRAMLGAATWRMIFIEHLDRSSVDVRSRLIESIVSVRPRTWDRPFNDDVQQLSEDLGRIHAEMIEEQQEQEEILWQMERNLQNEMQLATLRRLFRQAKVDLLRLISLPEHNATRQALDQCYEQIERIYTQLESSREFLILFDELRFDASVCNAKHDFLNRLYLLAPDED